MAQIEAFGLKFDTDNITTVHKMIAGAVVSIAILGAGTFYMVKPKYNNWTALKDEIAQQEQDIETKKSQVKRLPELKKELKEIEAKLVLLRRKIPTSTNVAPLLVDIDEITENKALYGNGALLKEFRPSDVIDFTLPAELAEAKGSETAKQLKQLPVSIQLSNISYPDLIKLLQDYESYERTLSLERLSIVPVENQDALYTPIDVSFTLKAFMLAGDK